MEYGCLLFGKCQCESKLPLELINELINNKIKKKDFRLHSVDIDRRDLMGYWLPMATIDQCSGEEGKGWNKKIYECKKRKWTWLHRLNRGRIYFAQPNVWIRQILFTFQSLVSLKVNTMSLIVSASVKVFRLKMPWGIFFFFYFNRFLRETTHCKASVAIGVN